MSVFTLSTSNGTHDASAWAEATAQRIFQIDPDLDGDRRLAARKLQLDMATALTAPIRKLQIQEISNLAAMPGYAAQRAVLVPHIANAMDALLDVTEGTPWDEQIHSQEWFQSATKEIEHQMLNVVHIERLWFADNHPDNEAAQNYKHQFHQG